MKIPQGWKERTLGEVLDYEQPTKYIVSSTEYRDSYKTPVLTAGKSFLIGHTNDKEGIYQNLPVIIFDDFTTASKFVDFPFKVKSSAMKLLTPKTEDVNLKYVFYYIQTLRINTSTHKRYYLSKYQKVKIPIPPIQIQDKIVQLLENAESAKKLRLESDELFTILLKSIFQDMFGKHKNKWIEKNLGEITDFIDYRGKTPIKTTSGIPLITAKNVKKGYISIEPREYIAEQDYAAWMTRGFPKIEDILFTTEAPLGNVAMLKKFDKIALAQRIITIRPKTGLNSYYLLFSLLSQEVQQKISRYSTGSTAKGIRSKNLAKVIISIPPIEMQNTFKEIVKHVEQIKGYQKDIEINLNNLFNSLVQRAFRGEL